MNKRITQHLAQYRAKQDGNTYQYPVPEAEIVGVVKMLYNEPTLELKTMFAQDLGGSQGFRVYYVFGVPKENVFLVPYIHIANEEFPSLARTIHETNGYERKIHSMMGLTPVGHPDLRPFILHENWPKTVFPLRKNFAFSKRPPEANGRYDFHVVRGEGIYEIPVGPVHAGIIEPGSFRFSVAGEEILLLEPKLGYKHRGVEKLFETLDVADMVRLSERVSGDTGFTHSLAFCQAIEQLAGISIPENARYLRVIYSELERLANHVSDIGFIMLDTGYSFGGSSCQRLREPLMQWNERLTGSRYFRGTCLVGGVTKKISKPVARNLTDFLELFIEDFREVVGIASESSSLFNRLEGTGTLTRQIALDHGVVGVAGRALGIPHDARKDYPYAGYTDLPVNLCLQEDGDVRSRLGVRVKEVYESVRLVKLAFSKLNDIGRCSTLNPPIRFKKNGLSIGVAEGWRGDIVYTVLTDENGNVTRVDVRDPSFLNWPPLALSGRGNVVPDFPLINKSFNLSYSGHDL